jgi:hypothetical protein
MQNPTTVVVTTAYSHRWYCTSSLAAFYTLLLSALHHFTSAHVRVMHAKNPGQSHTPSCSLAGTCRLQCPVLHVCKRTCGSMMTPIMSCAALHRSDPGGAMCLLLHGATCMAGALHTCCLLAQVTCIPCSVSCQQRSGAKRLPTWRMSPSLAA